MLELVNEPSVKIVKYCKEKLSILQKFWQILHWEEHI